MRLSDSELAMIRRHVRIGERHVAEQREIVDYFHKRGWPAEAAERLLFNFEQLLEEHRDHARRIAIQGWGVDPAPLIQ